MIEFFFQIIFVWACWLKFVIYRYKSIWQNYICICSRNIYIWNLSALIYPCWCRVFVLLSTVMFVVILIKYLLEKLTVWKPQCFDLSLLVSRLCSSFYSNACCNINKRFVREINHMETSISALIYLCWWKYCNMCMCVRIEYKLTIPNLLESDNRCTSRLRLKWYYQSQYFGKTKNSKNTPICWRSENLNLEEKTLRSTSPDERSIHYEKFEIKLLQTKVNLDYHYN